jgi:hypothetical protein
MNSRTDIERVLEGFLANGPEKVADQAVLRTLDAVDRTKQRRYLFAPWRFNLMITLPRLAAIALVAVVAIGGAAYLLGSSAGTATPAATQTAAPTLAPTLAPAPSPTVAAAIPTANVGMSLDTATWTSFTTSRYGYSVAWPNTPIWIHSAATEDWAGQTAAEMWDSSADAPWVDKFFNQSKRLTMTAVATTVPGNSTDEAFIDAYLKPGPGTTDGCIELAKDMRQIVIDGHRAWETTKCAAQAGFVAVGSRMYVFSISNQNEVPFLDAYLTTVKLPAGTT